jgi:hypothetical protein
MTMSEQMDCGHTEEQHAEMQELGHLIAHVQKIENPRVALVIQETGEVHFASSLAPGEAAHVLELMAARIRRYGGNYVHDHFDRGQAAQWN